MLTRKVRVFKKVREKQSDPRSSLVLISDGSALFHEWGKDYVEFEDGGCEYSIAIIEREDGKIETVAPDLIKFIK